MAEKLKASKEDQMTTNRLRLQLGDFSAVQAQIIDLQNSWILQNLTLSMMLLDDKAMKVWAVVWKVKFRPFWRMMIRLKVVGQFFQFSNRY